MKLDVKRGITKRGWGHISDETGCQERCNQKGVGGRFQMKLCYC